MIIWRISELASYGIDSVNLILKKIHNLQVIGYTFKQACDILEDYYKENRKRH